MVNLIEKRKTLFAGAFEKVNVSSVVDSFIKNVPKLQSKLVPVTVIGIPLYGTPVNCEITDIVTPLELLLLN